LLSLGDDLRSDILDIAGYEDGEVGLLLFGWVVGEERHSLDITWTGGMSGVSSWEE
jgi:hypothetical protein